jgi:protein gp37
VGKNSAIEWLTRRLPDGRVVHGHSFNPWWGCVKVSEECTNCYAATFDRRVHGKEGAHWGPRAPRRFFGDGRWNEPVRWNREAEREGVRPLVFCASMADVFERHPDLVEPRARLWDLIQATPSLDWLLLSKRPENMTEMAPAAWSSGWPPNVWAGTTTGNQKRADERIPHLLRVPAVRRFLSCEPLLGPVNFRWASWVNYERKPGAVFTEYDGLRGIHWIICGGESGAKARPMHPAWARSLRDQAVAAGVPFFFKQWGEHAACEDGGDGCWYTTDRTCWDGPPDHWPTTPHDLPGLRFRAVGKHASGRLLDGREWHQHPESSPLVVAA